jgi:hypothetical protein
MDTTALGRMACDLEEVPVPASGGDWMIAWHRPDQDKGTEPTPSA